MAVVAAKRKRTYRSRTFDYGRDFKQLDFRTHPDEYQIGRGEQGVLMVEPYKSEILPHWRFKSADIALKSARKIYSMFIAYKRARDFVGMDMARKFLQMGYTRARRYANHSSGRKYEANPQKERSASAEAKARKRVLPQSHDWGTGEKAQAARIFYGYYLRARDDPKYKLMKTEHQKKTALRAIQ